MFSIREIEEAIPSKYQVMVHRWDIPEDGKLTKYELTVELGNSDSEVTIEGVVVYTPEAIAKEVAKVLTIRGIDYSPEADLVLFS